MEKRSKKDIIWSGDDFAGREVTLFVQERDHIINGHENQGISNNFHAIYKTVHSPDVAYTSRESVSREVMYSRNAGASYEPFLMTAVVVEYPQTDKGYIVTAFPAKKEGKNIGIKIYPESDI